MWVKYGFYDLDRLMDVICICPSEFGEWQLGVESNGIYVVEEMIFARYWMFLQVYFHKIRRIYDYYMSHFLKREYTQYSEQLEKYTTYTDSMVLEDIRHSYGKNEWAKYLFNREHMKEVYVSEAQQENDEELERIARLIDGLKEVYKPEISKHLCYIDQADTSSAKSLIEIRTYKAELDIDGEEERKLPAIPVRDKHTDSILPIQKYSLPIRNISDKKINLFRVYSVESLQEEIRAYILKRKNEIPGEIEQEKQEEQSINQEIKELEQKQSDIKKIREERLNRYRR